MEWLLGRRFDRRSNFTNAGIAAFPFTFLKYRLFSRFKIFNDEGHSYHIRFIENCIKRVKPIQSI
jgi:hypothetical protein